MNATMNRAPTEADLAHITRELERRRRESNPPTWPHVLGRGPKPVRLGHTWPRAEYMLEAARALLRLGLTDTTGLPRTPVVEALEHAWALLRLTEEIDR